MTPRDIYLGTVYLPNANGSLKFDCLMILLQSLFIYKCEKVHTAQSFNFRLERIVVGVIS